MADLPAAMQLVEPEAVALMSADREDVEAIALLSAAISLKRIADALDVNFGVDRFAGQLLHAMGRGQ